MTHPACADVRITNCGLEHLMSEASYIHDTKPAESEREIKFLVRGELTKFKVTYTNTYKQEAVRFVQVGDKPVQMFHSDKQALHDYLLLNLRRGR